ncbi:MAG: biotin--[acetyl-CoA-carboxylase] ligase [Eggerthella lenta]
MGLRWGRACGCEQGALCALVLRRRLFVAPERRCACFGIWIRQRGEGGSPSGFPFRIALHEEVASTNDEVKRALEAGEPEGLVVRALRQVSGYGRQGRSWTSPEGGLYCSLLLRPQVAPRELPTLSLVVGMAVRRALVALAGARAEEAVRIKLPTMGAGTKGALCTIS